MAFNSVIYVPGFLGSELLRPFFGPLLETVWCQPTELLRGGFADLRLAVPGEDRPAPTGPPLLPGLPLPLVQTLMSGYLALLGWRVLSPSADWRRPIVHDALILRDLILSESKTGSVQIICHSRGGLVTRQALQFLDQLGKGDAVRRVIGMGCPHTGSMNAVKALAGTNPVIGKIVQWSDALPFASTVPIPLGVVCDCLRSWPGTYELLPSPAATWPTGERPSAYYLPGAYGASPVRPVQDYVAAAGANWSALPLTSGSAEWVDVCGVGVTTAIGLASLLAVTVPGSMSVSDAGDGTVPLASAHPADRRLVTSPCNHDLLPLDSRIWPVLHRALSDRLTADVILTGDVLTLHS